MDSFSISFAALWAALLLGAAPAGAQENASPAPIVFDAQSTTIDLNSHTATYKGLHIRQGNTSIEAAEATVHGFDSEHKYGKLEGKVRIQIGSATIRAEQGSFTFASNQLVSGELSGNPAVFEDSMPGNKGPVRGTAQSIDYDNSAGTVQMKGGAAFTVGKNQVKGCDLIYDLKQERLTSGSSDCGEPSFTITIVPGEKKPQPKEPKSAP